MLFWLPDRLLRRPADGNLRRKPTHLFGESASVSLMIRACTEKACPCQNIEYPWLHSHQNMLTWCHVALTRRFFEILQCIGRGETGKGPSAVCQASLPDRPGHSGQFNQIQVNSSGFNQNENKKKATAAVSRAARLLVGSDTQHQPAWMRAAQLLMHDSSQEPVFRPSFSNTVRHDRRASNGEGRLACGRIHASR